jgi:hypothetical protein
MRWSVLIISALYWPIASCSDSVRLVDVDEHVITVPIKYGSKSVQVGG